MKNTVPTILSAAALVIALAAGIFAFTCKRDGSSTTTNNHFLQAGDSTVVIPKIAYFNIDEVLDSYDMANELLSAFSTKAQNFQDQFTREQNSINNQYNKLQEEYNKGLVLPSVAEQKMQDIQKKSEQFSNNFSKKQQELEQENVILLNQIHNAIKEYVVKYNETHKYTFIYANQGGKNVILPNPVVVADTTYNITGEIISGLNDEYFQKKNNPETEE